jgi:hypothetical protein
MEAKISLISEGWIPLGSSLRNPADRKPSDREKRSVAELPSGDGGARQAVFRDGFYRPEDGVAEFLTFWIATARGWSQSNAFAWDAESRNWAPTDRAGPRPT